MEGTSLQLVIALHQVLALVYVNVPRGLQFQREGHEVGDSCFRASPRGGMEAGKGQGLPSECGLPEAPSRWSAGCL